MSDRWILKFLSGPHAGGEMALDSRDYLLGGGEDADIVLHDNTIPDEAVDIRVEGAEVYLKPRPGVSLHASPDTGPLLDFEQPVVAYQVYSLGVLCFCFGHEGGSWPQVRHPVILPHPAALEAPAQEPLAAGVLSNGGGAGALSGFGKLATGTAVLLALGFGGALFFENSHGDAVQEEQSQSLNLAGLLTADPKYRFLGLDRQLIPGKEELWLISGYVRSADDLGDLRKLLQKSALSVELNIRVMENVKRSTEILLKQLRLDYLLVDIGDDPGELVISGIQKDSQAWQRKKEILLSDIPGLLAIEDKVESVIGRINILKDWIREEGLNDEVKVHLVDGRFTVTSDIDLEKSLSWKRIMRQYEARFGGSIDLSLIENHRPRIAVRSVSLGEIPYLILENGRRYSHGSHLSDGYYLDEITKDNIVLKRGDEVLKYSIGTDSLGQLL